MLLFKDVVIDLESTYLNQKIMYTYNKQHWRHWMWLWDVLFYMCERCYFLKYCCWRAKMIIHGRTTCRIAHHVIFLTWMPNWSFFGYSLCQPLVYVMRVIFRGRNYVGVWSMFERLAFGVFDATFEWHTCQQMVLPLMHNINLKTSIVK